MRVSVCACANLGLAFFDNPFSLPAFARSVALFALDFVRSLACSLTRTHSARARLSARLSELRGRSTSVCAFACVCIKFGSLAQRLARSHAPTAVCATACALVRFCNSARVCVRACVCACALRAYDFCVLLCLRLRVERNFVRASERLRSAAPNNCSTARAQALAAHLRTRNSPNATRAPR